MALRVLHLSTYDSGGGAARASYALHRAMHDAGVDSTLWVAQRTIDDVTVRGARGRGSLRFRVAQRLDRQLWRVQRSSIDTWRSPAIFGSLNVNEINDSAADVVNLHWVTSGFLSIRDIARITKPMVWSVYDMWPFSGAEHYGPDGVQARWRGGYTRANRPSTDRGVDLDRLIWERKRSLWRRPIPLMVASTWMQERVEASALMGPWPVQRVPHPIDCEVFRPLPMDESRQHLGLASSVPLIFFLSSGGISDSRKGWDLLESALPLVQRVHPRIGVIIAGPVDHSYRPPSGVSVHWAGTVASDSELARYYSAAEVTVVPSRVDNMPLTAMEAHSCGRPVVAFAIGGLTDIVDHGITGYLAKPFDVQDCASGILHALTPMSAAENWGLAARRRALETWAGPVVVEGYLKGYRAAGAGDESVSR